MKKDKFIGEKMKKYFNLINNFIIPFSIIIFVIGCKQNIQDKIIQENGSKNLYPIIEKIIIPPAGTSAFGKSVTATIKGKNFLSSSQNINLFCESEHIISNLNKTVLNDTTMTVELNISSQVGEYIITARAIDTEQSAPFIVRQYDVKTGDYVLKNGTYIRQSFISELSDEQKAEIFGVISISESGIPIILGLEQSQTELKWAETDTTGFYTNFEENCSYETVYGYSFSEDFDGSDNWSYICNLDSDASTMAKTNYPAFYYANSYGNSLKGTGFEDDWYIPSIKELYDVYNNLEIIQESFTSIKGIPVIYYGKDVNFWSSTQGCFQYNDVTHNYAAQLNFDDGAISYSPKNNSCTVLVCHAFNPDKFSEFNYGTTIIECVEIPTVGEGFEGEIPIIIKGKNLKGAEISSEDTSFSNVQYINNTKATATIKTNGKVGEYSVTVNCGSSNGVGTYKIIDKERCFNVGDVLFSDGTRIKVENLSYGGIPDEQIDKAFCVIASSLYGGGTGLALGLKESKKGIAWTISTTLGYKTKLEEIAIHIQDRNMIDYENDQIYNNFTNGDFDGSDNWDYLCSIDPEGTKNPEQNYPVFHFANTYGIFAGLTGTKYENGWYIPSIKELYDMSTNLPYIQTSLKIAGGFFINFPYSYSKPACDYWSSTQCILDYDRVYNINFSIERHIYEDFKDLTKHAVVFQSFGAEEFYDFIPPTPQISLIEFPTIGNGYVGDVSVKIYGNNLIGHQITSSDSSFKNVQYVNDSKVIATITNNRSVGEYPITINCGPTNKTENLKIIAQEECYNSNDIGKIVLVDGSFVTKDSFNLSTMSPIGVVAGLKYNGGQCFAVGLQCSEDGLCWAFRGTEGETTNFEGIRAYHKETENGYIITGDCDGSDNWDYICSVELNGTKNPNLYYPAFDFANTYGINSGLTGTKFETGWYIPSIKELFDMYLNKETVANSLEIAGGFTLYRENYGLYYHYFSSSQRGAESGDSSWGERPPIEVSYACDFGSEDALAYYACKSDYFDVLVIQAFNVE